uniref:Uncharacterized protein n=1 Tax=Micrurus corallinus TaxID=54390 RepID=A0A2D4EVE3_MICCO
MFIKYQEKGDYMVKGKLVQWELHLFTLRLSHNSIPELISSQILLEQEKVILSLSHQQILFPEVLLKHIVGSVLKLYWILVSEIFYPFVWRKKRTTHNLYFLGMYATHLTIQSNL